MNFAFQDAPPAGFSILNVPGFPSLPKGARRMLLFSETHFFNQPASRARDPQEQADEAGAGQALNLLFDGLMRRGEDCGSVLQGA
jgi:hypothetical protein